MTPKELVEEIDGRLQAAGTEEMREGQQRFFRHEVEAYGVRMPELRVVVREVYREIRGWPLARRNELMKRLWELKKLEAGALVCHVYRRFRRECAGCEFRLFERWIDRYVRNWAHTDGVGTWLVAACLENEPDLRHELVSWTASSNRWKRRAAAVSLLQEGKAGRHLDTILEVSERLVDDRDDMVEKGVGWLLKETYPKSPGAVMAFLMERRARISRVTLRYAAEKMTAGDRKKLLHT